MQTANVFRDFEKVAIVKLCSGVLSAADLSSVFDHAEFVSLDHSGGGYFLTARHHALPQERTVCSEPHLVGRGSNVDLGFVVFLQNGEITLECHAWSADAVPKNIRDLPVVVHQAEAHDQTR